MRAISRIYLFLCACGLYCSLLLLYMTYNYKSCLFLQCYCIISLTVVEWNAFLLILFAKFLPFSFCPTFKSFSFFVLFVCWFVSFWTKHAWLVKLKEMLLCFHIKCTENEMHALKRQRKKEKIKHSASIFLRHQQDSKQTGTFP